MPGAPTDTLPPFPSFSDAFTQFSRTSLPPSTPTFHPDLIAPLPSDGSATLKSSADLLARGLRRSGKPPLKRKRAAVKPDHFVPRTAEKDGEEGDEEASNEMRGMVRREGPARTQRIVTRASVREGRKRYREESSEDEGEGIRAVQSSDDDFM